MKSQTYPKNVYNYNEDYIVGTWINGEPVYRHLLNFNIPVHNDSKLTVNQYTISTQCLDVINFTSICYRPTSSTGVSLNKIPVYLTDVNYIISDELKLDTTTNTLTYFIYNGLRQEVYDNGKGFLTVDYIKS